MDWATGAIKKVRVSQQKLYVRGNGEVAPLQKAQKLMLVPKSLSHPFNDEVLQLTHVSKHNVQLLRQLVQLSTTVYG